ncbi:hypothetical protein MNBD_UNCLBAC01-283 [hydrothermal vent metagenome]|uniref:Uncharacterized protein n=1 Tax=hydrothermal vent metagenome TaxID=652676 RepID=A0A3B1D9Y1_9ZZZZ
MSDLKFPIIKNTNAAKKILSIDEYLKFVQFHLKYTFDEKAYAKWKKILPVNVPFSMK